MKLKNLLNKTLQFSKVILMPENEYEHLPYKGDANSYAAKRTPSGKIIQLRYYNSNGDAYVDYDFTDHNDPIHHIFKRHKGAHKHYLYRDESCEENDMKRTRGKEMKDWEYRKFVKNYKKLNPKIINVKYIEKEN